MLDEDFRTAKIDTGYLERLLADGAAVQLETVPEDVVALAAALFASCALKESVAVPDAGAESRWAVAGRREGLRL